MVINKSNADHYHWGERCDGWHYLRSPTLSVIRERMPPHTSERSHHHHRAQQLFVVLSGIATFTVDDEQFTVREDEAIHIKPGSRHTVANEQGVDLHFLAISEPPSHADRHEIA